MRLRLACMLATTIVLLGGSALVPAYGGGTKNGTSLGGNWAGYAVDAPGVTAVRGQFVVPKVDAVAPGLVAEWVGVGGFTTTDLIQAGVGEDYIPGFGVEYYPWYELLPASETRIDQPVQPGDHITVAVKDTGDNLWKIRMADAERGWTFSIVLSYASLHSSAEWIVEAPSLSGVVYTAPPLMDAAVFDGPGNSVTVGGVTTVLGNANPTKLIVDDATVQPSDIDSDGDGFAVCEYSVSCAPPSS